MTKIKIGIDFHDTITADPKRFKIMMQLFIDMGVEIHIMTGARRQRFDEECVKLGISLPFTHFFSITDYYLDKSPNIVDLSDPNHPRIENKHLWDVAKSYYAERNEITLVIDNEQAYGDCFVTPFLLYKQEAGSK